MEVGVEPLQQLGEAWLLGRALQFEVDEVSLILDGSRAHARAQARNDGRQRAASARVERYSSELEGTIQIVIIRPFAAVA